MVAEPQICYFHTSRFPHEEGRFWDYIRHFLRRVAKGCDRECHIGKSTDERVNDRPWQTVICEDGYWFEPCVAGGFSAD
jgi:hypothetical protein